MEEIRVEWFRGRAGLEALAPAWRALTDGARGMRWFHQLAWYESYVEALAPDESAIWFAALQRGGAVLAILPLCARRARVHGVPVRLLECPDHPHLPLSDLVCTMTTGEEACLGPDVLRSLARAGPRCDVIVFRRALEDSGIRRLLEANRMVRSVCERRQWCSELPAVDFEEHLSRFSKNFRGNLRKARNRVERTSEVEWVTARDLPRLRSAFRELCDTEASGWKGRGAAPGAIQSSPELTRFYEGVIERFGSAGQCEINLLRVGGVAIAAQFNLLVDETCYVLKIGYRESHAQLAPGNALMERRLREAATDVRVRFVNLVTNAPWHEDWRPARHAVYRCSIFFGTPRGMAAFVATRCRVQAQPLYDATIRPLLARRRDGRAAGARKRER